MQQENSIENQSLFELIFASFYYSAPIEYFVLTFQNNYVPFPSQIFPIFFPKTRNYNSSKQFNLLFRTISLVNCLIRPYLFSLVRILQKLHIETAFSQNRIQMQKTKCFEYLSILEVKNNFLWIERMLYLFSKTQRVLEDHHRTNITSEFLEIIHDDNSGFQFEAYLKDLSSYLLVQTVIIQLYQMNQKQSKYHPETFMYSPRSIFHKSPQIVFQEINKNQHCQNTNRFYDQNKKSGTITTIESSSTCLLDLIEIYQWRKQTQYPIIRSNWKKVIFNNFTFDSRHKKQLTTFIKNNAFPRIVKLQVQTEFVLPLQYYQSLPITQFLYAIKQSAIAFQRLFSLFGSYSVTSKMITVNSQGKLKVWLSPGYDQNIKIDQSSQVKQSEAQSHILNKIKTIFGKFSQDSQTFRDFFSFVQNASSFIALLKRIQEFSQSKKIITAKRIIKKPQMSFKRPVSPKVNIRPVSRAPKFINPPVFNQNKKQEHDLALVSKKSIKQQKFHIDTVETNQTLTRNNSNSKISNQKNALLQYNSFGGKYGKIVKNRMNIWLQNAKSMKNLPRYSPIPSIQNRLEPNSIEKNMNRLFDQDEDCKKYEGNLMKLGRSVRQSITEQRTNQ